jgi:hypothetical protein
MLEDISRGKARPARKADDVTERSDNVDPQHFTPLCILIHFKGTSGKQYRFVDLLVVKQLSSKEWRLLGCYAVWLL